MIFLSGEFMKRVIILLVVLLLVAATVSATKSLPRTEREKEYWVVLPYSRDDQKQAERKETEYDQILKQLREKINEWLKSLNERIEREDVTRFEVRFLEILRSVLEWVKEKIDAKVGPEENKEAMIWRGAG
jgi:type VI protein secretion system component VasK